MLSVLDLPIYTASVPSSQSTGNESQACHVFLRCSSLYCNKNADDKVSIVYKTHLHVFPSIVYISNLRLDKEYDGFLVFLKQRMFNRKVAFCIILNVCVCVYYFVSLCQCVIVNNMITKNKMLFGFKFECRLKFK